VVAIHEEKTRKAGGIFNPEAHLALHARLAELQGDEALLPTLYLFRSREGVNRPISRVQAWRILEEVYATNGLTASWESIRCGRPLSVAYTTSWITTW
jgi:hypothetical protein